MAARDLEHLLLEAGPDELTETGSAQRGTSTFSRQRRRLIGAARFGGV